MKNHIRLPPAPVMGPGGATTAQKPGRAAAAGTKSASANEWLVELIGGLTKQVSDLAVKVESGSGKRRRR